MEPAAPPPLLEPPEALPPALEPAALEPPVLEPAALEPPALEPAVPPPLSLELQATSTVPSNASKMNQENFIGTFRAARADRTD